MNYVERVEHWGETHHPKWLDFVRVGLGLFLLVKGIDFANNMNGLLNMMSTLPFENFIMIILAHYILFAHVFGGVLLATGLLTRLACVIQLPVLVAAVFWNMAGTLSGLGVVLVLLALVIYFMVLGGGRWSLDWYVNREYERRLHHERDFY